MKNDPNIFPSFAGEMPTRLQVASLRLCLRHHHRIYIEFSRKQHGVHRGNQEPAYLAGWAHMHGQEEGQEGNTERPLKLLAHL